MKYKRIIKNEILKYLTEDFDSNQHIFDKQRGYAVYNGTDLTMVMDAVVGGITSANEVIENDFNGLTKGIDELLKKYEDENELVWHDIMCNKKDTPTYNSLSGELKQVNQILEDLKKLKGE